MNFDAFNYGANAVCFMKNGHKYGMICAWAMQVDFDRVLMIFGTQSVTGKNIAKGDIIGVSVLSTKQKDVVKALGYTHSDETDKFENLDYTIEGSAILINDASLTMIVEVIDVLHLPGIEEDNLVYGIVKSYTRCDDPMLSLRDLQTASETE
jgi:flavin reductase (DIM6/NTAB) family NADH-FMN oxidoreductase RutF